MIVSQKRSMRGFGGIPGNAQEWMVAMVPRNPDESKNAYNDGLIKNIPNFVSRWGAMVNLSNEVDAVRDDPAAASLVRQEAGLALTIQNNLYLVRQYQPDNNGIFGRSAENEAIRQTAIKDLSNAMTQYMETIKPALDGVKASIDAREKAKADAAIQTQIAVVAAKKDEISKIEAAMARNREVASSSGAMTAKYELERVKTEKAIKKAETPAWVMPVAIIGGLAVVGGLAALVMRRKPAAAMAGYRRRRSRR